MSKFTSLTWLSERLGRKQYRLLLVGVGLAPIMFCLYLVYLAPRPYYITEMDSEQDYYYNAQLIASGLPVTGIHHPGTAIYHLGGLILRLSGSDLEATQRFFNFAYLAIALVTAISLLAFTKLLLKDVAIGVSALTLASIAAWPPFLTYLNFFGAESFIFALGLPVIACFWRTLENHAKAPRGRAFICGLGLGVCLATKMSFVPVAVALFVAWSSHCLLSELEERRELKRTLGNSFVRCATDILSLLGGLAFAFLTVTAPIFNRVLTVLSRTFSRPDAFPSGRNWLAGFQKTIAVLWEVSPPYVLFVFVASATVLLLLATQVYRDRIGTKEYGTTLATVDKFDYVAGGVFITLMLIAFVYTGNAAVGITPGAEAGVRLRNMSPTMLFVPFTILYCDRLARKLFSWERKRRSVVQGVLTLIAVIVFIGGITAHIKTRNRIIEEHASRIAITKLSLGSLVPASGRIAFWTESAQDFLGEVSFHNWGNYRYARGQFNEKLMEAYSSYTFFRLRNIRQFSATEVQDQQDVIATSRYGKVGELYWNFRHWLSVQGPHTTLSYENDHMLVAGEQDGVRVSTIAYPQSETKELGVMTQAELLSMINARFGPPKLRRELIGDIEWVLISIPDSF